LKKRRSSFIYKIDTDEPENKLLDKIKQFVNTQRINFNSNRPWHGFLAQENVVIFQKVGKYYLTKFGFEIKAEVILFNQEIHVNYLQEEVPVIFDVYNKYVVINSSSSSHRTVVQTAMMNHLQDKQYIRLNRITYKPEFLKWLVNNAIDNSDIIIKINWAKITELIDYDENTTDVAVGSDDQVRDSDVYKQVENEGKHISLKSFVRINEATILTRIYATGQITMVAEFPEYGTYLTQLVNELERLRNLSGTGD